MKFSQEDKDFLNSLNGPGLPVESRIYVTAQHGYMRNLDRDKLERLEAIYKQYVNPKYVLCYHCPADILQVTLAVYRELDKELAQAEAEATVAASVPAATAQAGKPKQKQKAKGPEKIIGEGDE